MLTPIFLLGIIFFTSQKLGDWGVGVLGRNLLNTFAPCPLLLDDIC